MEIITGSDVTNSKFNTSCMLTFLENFRECPSLNFFICLFLACRASTDSIPIGKIADSIISPPCIKILFVAYNTTNKVFYISNVFSAYSSKCFVFILYALFMAFKMTANLEINCCRHMKYRFHQFLADRQEDPFLIEIFFVTNSSLVATIFFQPRHLLAIF